MTAPKNFPAGAKPPTVPAAAPRRSNQHGAPAGFQVAKFVGAKRGHGVWQRIISEMPPHRLYVEPFLGTGSIAKLKRQAEETIVNDRDGHAMMSFRKWVANNGGGRSYQFRCEDAVGLLRQMMEREALAGQGMTSLPMPTLIYCDPPYLGAVRADAGRRYYRHEMMDEREHRSLLQVLIRFPLRVMVMLSGYRSDLYDAALVEWRRVDIPTSTRSGRATECLWMNYPEPCYLHDYRWLGDGWRAREMLNRKRARWRAKFLAMDVLERRALLAALEDVL